MEWLGTVYFLELRWWLGPQINMAVLHFSVKLCALCQCWYMVREGLASCGEPFINSHPTPESQNSKVPEFPSLMHLQGECQHCANISTMEKLAAQLVS